MIKSVEVEGPDQISAEHLYIKKYENSDKNGLKEINMNEKIW